jgi:hypothetical protein
MIPAFDGWLFMSFMMVLWQKRRSTGGSRRARPRFHIFARLVSQL